MIEIIILHFAVRVWLHDIWTSLFSSVAPCRLFLRGASQCGRIARSWDWQDESPSSIHFSRRVDCKVEIVEFVVRPMIEVFSYLFTNLWHNRRKNSNSDKIFVLSTLISTHISFFIKIIFFPKLSFFSANSLTNILFNKQKEFFSQKKQNVFGQCLKILTKCFS